MEEGFRDFQAWFNRKPIFARTYLIIVVALAVIVWMKIVSPYHLYYTFETGFLNLQLWRPFTAILFMGKLDFSFIFSIMFVHIGLVKVETQVFRKETYADFIWFLTITFLALVTVASFIQIGFLSSAFIMVLIYVWCKRFPHQELYLLFSFRVKSGMFPWAFTILNIVLFEASYKPYLIGIALGHIYIFVKDIVFVKYGRDYLPTPQFLTNWWRKRMGLQPARQNVQQHFGGNWVRIG